MKCIVLLLFIFSISHPCFAQYFSYNKGATTATNYYQEIPYEDINGKIVIQVAIEGENYKFLFDTGATLSLGMQLSHALTAPVIHTDTITDVNGHKGTVQVVSIKSIKLGALEFKDVPALKLMPDIYQCWNADGVIGSNLLRNSIVQIDAVRHLIILTDQPDKLSLNAMHGNQLILDTIQSNPRIKVQLAGNSDMVLGFDTGDNGFLRLSESFMQQLKKFKVFEQVAMGYGANSIGSFGYEKNNEKYLLKFPFLKIGDTRFSNVYTATTKGGIPGIGTKLLNYGVVTLDYIHHQFYFAAANPKIDLYEKQWPFQPSITGNKLTIGVVWEKGKKLVQLGEQIVTIDEVSYETVNLCDFLNHTPVLAGKEQATFTIKNARGNVREIKVIKE